MFSLKGRTALVAGASRGIGLAIAQQMAAAGAHTILAARSRDALALRVRDLTSHGLDAVALEMDISTPELVEVRGASVGAVDILVNVAGTNVRKRFEDYSREDYDRLLETNLHGIVRLKQKLGVRMIERGKGGKVINIGSMMSIVSLPYLSVYAISKGGLG